MIERTAGIQKGNYGFALPTVLIASTVMLIVLASTLVSVASGAVKSLDSRHYDAIAKAAAQSGLAMAQACLKANDYVPSWSDSAPLRPNTDCQGVVQSGVSQYLHDGDGTRSTFTVPAPSALANGVQRVTVSSSTDRVRASNGNVWQTYNYSSYATISGQNAFSSVTFGYIGLSGSYFGVVNPSGGVTAVGYNGYGQLGNGTTTDTTSPKSYILPAGVTASQLYANFLSVGFNMFVISTDGRLYGAGLNDSGQLGNGSTSSAQSTPVQFQLPSGVQARYVSSGSNYTYVIGSDNNVYSSGSCLSGVLGYSYTISGCSNQSTARRVALPTPNTSDPNTLPVASNDWLQSTNLAVDRSNAFLRMQGGRVYGWGTNNHGQLGNSSYVDSSTPVQYGSLGDAGQPKAIQVAFDGESSWVLDSNGDVWTAGWNGYGELGASASMFTPGGKCMDNPNNSTGASQIELYDCNNSTAQSLHFDSDGSIKFHPDASTTLCLDNTNNSNANGNMIRTWGCNGTAAQIWQVRDDNSIYSPSTGKCLDVPNNNQANGTFLQLYDCNGSDAQKWYFYDKNFVQKVWRPQGHGKIVRVTTDQWSTLYLMEDGTVWGAGNNELGQLGIGGPTLKQSPALKQMVLPVGRKATEIYTTLTGASYAANFIANTYVVLDDGSVYGTGSNASGQLGVGYTSAYVTTPVKMNLPAGVIAKSVQAGLGTAVVLTNQGRIYTVGNNANGQLGDGTTTNSSTPSARQYVNTRPLLLY